MQKLHLNCPINGVSYGISSLQILKGLLKHRDITLWPISQVSLEKQEDVKLIQTLVNKQQSPELDLNAPTIRIYHQNMLGERIGRGKSYGYPFFELDTFTSVEKTNLNSVDHLLVASKWAKEVCLKNDIKVPIDVVNLGVDEEECGQIRKEPKAHYNRCVFITIGKWEIRKGHADLYRVFDKAFSDKDDVELWLVTHNFFNTKEENEQWEAYYKYSKMGQAGKIRIYPRIPKHNDVLRLINKADCAVFLSRAEGWNLGLLESMALGKECIATNYSAHTEYLSSDNCHLIPIDNLEDAYDLKFFNGTGKWASFGENQESITVEYLRHIYNRWKDGEDLTNHKGIETAQKFTWENTVNQLLQIL